MIWVSYRAISSKGRDVRGKIEAESIAMAIKSLRKEGLTPYETTIDSLMSLKNGGIKTY